MYSPTDTIPTHIQTKVIESDRQKVKHKWIDGRAYILANKQTDRQTIKQIDRRVDRRMDGHANTHIIRQTDG